jgi:hypothetical protein
MNILKCDANRALGAALRKIIGDAGNLDVTT